ncbi:MAG: glycosyltransferase family 4 protein [Pseudomonadota bacterium]
MNTFSASGRGDSPRILAFTQGAPFSRHSFSGSNFGLLRGLQNDGALVHAEDIEVYGWRRRAIMLRHWHPDHEVWKHRFRAGRRLRQARENRAALGAARHDPNSYNTVLQMGAEFASHAAVNCPVYSYHDNTAKISSRATAHSFTQHATLRQKQLRIEAERRIYHANRGVFVFSEFVKRSLVHDYGVDPERVTVVHSGVSIEETELSDQPAPGKFERPKVLFIGRDFERKGGPEVLAAFAEVKKQIPDATLVIAGCSPKIAQPDVRVLGFIDQRTIENQQRILNLYREASLYVMPSHFEPFGIPFCEAMLFHTPCIGTETNAIPEMVKNDVTGYVVPVGNVEALRDRMLQVLSNPAAARTMGSAGYEFARERFLWRCVAAKMKQRMAANMIEDAAAQPRKRRASA